MRLLRVLRIEGEAAPRQEGGALSSWSPLRRPLFRALWIAALASNVGAWIQDVGSAWLMTSLAPSPIMVSLLQTAASLPFFLLALPAGAVADIVDRRRVLLVAQGWMLGAAAILGVLTLLRRTTPWILIVLVFAYGLGAAVNLPAWQATMLDLVPSGEMPSAVTLSSITINLSRAIGPAKWRGGPCTTSNPVAPVWKRNSTATSNAGLREPLCTWNC